ncbi:MoxR family ATPase [Streptomyces chiangmaiensis]|uniref:MoxR family ATPase n=1 Tax=Streptomyces chiangmaiensis TaxID=766497 RepID=A0ABU7FVV1_9ACTN|nr:MoxR family ATPase [Streptomyces chiangmaiensis]MED7828010.1 MoxR family ATPase [Streptomyces chiangmaiensis]
MTSSTTLLTTPAPAVGAPAPTPADASGTGTRLVVAENLLTLLRTTTTEPRPDEQLEALTLAVAADLPVLLWGEPGIGKTAALTQLAASLDLPLTTVIASVHEPTDFSGLPIVGDDPTAQGVPMAPPQWAVELVRAGRGLLFLDELSTATPAVQAALLRVVLERRVGALQLPPGVRIVAAANPRASAADGWELSPPLANRFVHLYWVHDREVVVRGLGGIWPRAELPRLVAERLPEAVAYARRAVCGFLEARPTLIHRLPSTETRRGGAWPSPRSWEAALTLLAFGTAAAASREVLALLVRGAVGDGPGLELLAHLDRMELPDPESLLADPASAELPARGDLRQAALEAVVAAVGVRPQRARWEAGWAVLVRALETGVPDLLVAPATALAALRRDDWEVPEAVERLARVIGLARLADQSVGRATAGAGAGRTEGARR